MIAELFDTGLNHDNRGIIFRGCSNSRWGVMKAVILAGGLGTRLSEETNLRPKPMVEIGGMPIIWHLMKIYSTHGINDFIICLGYKGYVIKEFFANYFLHMSDITIDLQDNSLEIYNKKAEPWKVTLIDTGDFSETAERLKRVKEFIPTSEPFCFTYGDGLSDVDITKSIEFHNESKKLVTMTAVSPISRYGAIDLEDNNVKRFVEKPENSNGLINGGFFVVSPAIFDSITSENESWEKDTLPKLALINQLSAFKHSGFWHAMDTLRDKTQLETLWNTKKAPWKNWK